MCGLGKAGVLSPRNSKLAGMDFSEKEKDRCRSYILWLATRIFDAKPLLSQRIPEGRARMNDSLLLQKVRRIEVDHTVFFAFVA